jgi:hypothetical protein
VSDMLEQLGRFESVTWKRGLLAGRGGDPSLSEVNREEPMARFSDEESFDLSEE